MTVGGGTPRGPRRLIQGLTFMTIAAVLFVLFMAPAASAWSVDEQTQPSVSSSVQGGAVGVLVGGLSGLVVGISWIAIEQPNADAGDFLAGAALGTALGVGLGEIVGVGLGAWSEDGGMVALALVPLTLVGYVVGLAVGVPLLFVQSTYGLYPPPLFGLIAAGIGQCYVGSQCDGLTRGLIGWEDWRGARVRRAASERERREAAQAPPSMLEVPPTSETDPVDQAPPEPVDGARDPVDGDGDGDGFGDGDGDVPSDVNAGPPPGALPPASTTP